MIFSGPLGVFDHVLDIMLCFLCVSVLMYDIGIKFDMIWYMMIWYDMIWYDMIWYDMIWYDMIWYGINFILKYIPCTEFVYRPLLKFNKSIFTVSQDWNFKMTLQIKIIDIKLKVKIWSRQTNKKNKKTFWNIAPCAIYFHKNSFKWAQFELVQWLFYNA